MLLPKNTILSLSSNPMGSDSAPLMAVAGVWGEFEDGYIGFKGSISNPNFRVSTLARVLGWSWEIVTEEDELWAWIEKEDLQRGVRSLRGVKEL